MNAGKLIVAGTPVGNLEDMTQRAKKALEEADFILAEDTRRSIKLLNHYAIGKKELISFSQQKERQKTDGIIERIRQGEIACIVSDAGMPCVSDPGSFIVNECYNNDIKVDVIPGPSAFVLAYAASGFSGSFIFEGFIGRDKKFRRFLRKNIEESRHIIFYESPYRLKKVLTDIKAILEERDVFIAREMTKMHQEFFRGSVSDAIAHFNGEVKGEITVIIKGS